MSIKIEFVPEIPNFMGRDRWQELYTALQQMEVGQVIRLTTNDKSSAKSAQSSIQATTGNMRHRVRLLEGLRFTTRTCPASEDQNGQWFLYIKKEPKISGSK